jgi:hypothetical protein
MFDNVCLRDVEYKEPTAEEVAKYEQEFSELRPEVQDVLLDSPPSDHLETDAANCRKHTRQAGSRTTSTSHRAARRIGLLA